MNSQTDRFRKAAILVANLDSSAAAALYDSFSLEDAESLRHAVDDLTEIDGEEQQAVLAEFLGDRSHGSDELGVELDDNLARRLAGFEQLGSTSAELSLAPRATGFSELAEVDAAELIRCLDAEHPQTVAVVLAQLTAARAAEVLQAWDTDRRNELLERIATLAPTPPELLREIEQELLARVRASVEALASSQRSEARVAAILAAADEPVRMGWRDRQAETQTTEPSSEQETDFSIRRHFVASEPTREPEHLADGETLVRTIATESSEGRPIGRVAMSAAVEAESVPSPLAWAELARFDDQSLATLYAAAPAETVRLALAGADVGMVQRMRRHLGPRAARLLDRQLQRLDAVRISDIVEAQRRLAELAELLVRQGVLAAQWTLSNLS